MFWGEHSRAVHIVLWLPGFILHFPMLKLRPPRLKKVLDEARVLREQTRTLISESLAILARHDEIKKLNGHPEL